MTEKSIHFKSQGYTREQAAKLLFPSIARRNLVYFWCGFVLGMIMVASMDLGDVRLCVGACG